MRQPNESRTRTHLRAALLVVALLAVAGPATAQEPADTAAKAAGREHVVRKGDTLWDLAAFYLSNPFRWGLIFDANRDVVEDPHWIYPDEHLVIPGLPPAQGDVAAVPVPMNAPSEKASPGAAAGAARRTRFYRTGGMTQRSGAIDLEAPGAQFAQVQPGDFYAAPWLARPSDLPRYGRVVAVVGRSAGGDDMERTSHPYDEVYLEYMTSSRPEVGDRLLLVQAGRGVGGYGRMIEPVAIVSVGALDEDVMTASIVEQFGMVEKGAVALPLDAYPGPFDAPAQAVESGPQGVLIAFEQVQPLVAPRDRAFVDLGRADGIEVGDELLAFLPSGNRGGAGTTLPPEEVGRLRVVRVADRTATVQVVSLDQPSLRTGMPVQLVAKRP